ncbi:RNA polymerase sigma-70 factor, ECF subfamily [Dyadobacter koreensis]|uniref:RNA polymerase sigma-70 factor, ECF subfamily n=1 Tax=Dyadobacter koreensis TaxID=408657 RepID=A0A1H6QHB2_9BACT|nr:sigma-70 family RNA polymerase sigma factor [Dyadobacter koreensis]SEI43109.1 RNA polymerase sigma-70 factor, ECF subfamily [Dyadobacter koreensis]
MRHPEDQVYIDKINEGDSSAYRYLVNRYKDMAFTIALRIMRNTEDAEEVAQDGFVKAYQQIHRFEGKSKFSTWLYTIIYRTAITKLNRRGVLLFSVDENLTDHFTYDETAPQIEAMHAQEQTKLIKNAIIRLPEIDGLLITLFYLNENTVKEIEEITGLTASNIKVKLFRARKILEAELRFLL